VPEPSNKIRELLSARRLGHDANQLLVDIMERWGGTKKFADDLFTEFQAAKAGSLIRQNLLEMIQKLIVNNTNHNITKIVDPSDLDDEEIESEMRELLRRAKDWVDEREEPVPPTHTPAWAVEEPPEDGAGPEWDWPAD
jgi:Glu-tRNA(Gln) amidotransferase subunit E-like FAD-binding protein